MHDALAFTIEQQLARTSAALRANRMQVTCVQTAQEVVPLVQSILQDGDSVAAGGSMSLVETEVMSLLDCGSYNYFNRDVPSLTPDERTEVMHKAFDADYYFASANAVTEEGEIYQVDGNANRIAAIAYGPKNVILVVGYNKIVPDLPAAIARVENIAAPANAKRLNCKTPCAVTGQCMHCKSPGCICRSKLILGPQMIENRIHVILVAESLGF